MPKIDLDPFLGRGSGRVYILSGKDRGLDLRQKFALDELDKSSDPVLVSVPSDLHRMTPSFVLGLFSRTFDALSRDHQTKPELIEAFKSKYRFQSQDETAKRIEGQIIESIDDFYGTKSALADLISGFTQKNH